MGLTARAPSLLPMKLKPRVIYLYPTPMVFAKVLKRSVGDMVYKPSLKVTTPSKTYWSPPGTKMPWSKKVGQYTGSGVVTSSVMMNT